jgi:hypothetical protein
MRVEKIRDKQAFKPKRLPNHRRNRTPSPGSFDIIHHKKRYLETPVTTIGETSVNIGGNNGNTPPPCK